ncbi:MAG: cytochrome c1 [Gammaproteobacteria bacterium]
MKKLLIFTLALIFPVLGAAAGDGAALDLAGNNLANLKSLPRGAKYYVNYCLGCHSLKYVRYDRVGRDLSLTETQLMDNLMFTAEKPSQMMVIAMPVDDAERWFGRAPPDLSLAARSRGVDWIYTYMRSFYLDDTRPLGVNNIVIPGASMPHVLAEMQGYQIAHFKEWEDEEGNTHEQFDRFELIKPGKLSAAEFDMLVRDLVNFLEYVSEPVQVKRQHIGIGVLAFLLVFFIFAFFLKREYWRDIH